MQLECSAATLVSSGLDQWDRMGPLAACRIQRSLVPVLRS